MSNNSALAPKPFNPFRSIYDLFSSVWFGIFLMVLIFFYMSIASAGFLHPMDWNDPFGTWTRLIVRERFNKTEMEVFAWWPFNLLMALFTLNMIVVTLRRIRLTVLSLGVWMIHTGIVVLTLGSVYYFHNKLEGDTPVFRRSVVIDVPGAAAPQRLLVRPNNRVFVKGADGEYSFSIAGINPSWPLLSGEDEGKTACSINVAVTTPTQQFIRQMLIGYPQYTEDIIPGQGRAVKSTGKKLLDESLNLALDYEPQSRYYIKDSSALYVRKVGETEWKERRIEGLPHYKDYVSRRSEVWAPDGYDLSTNGLDIALTPESPDDPLADVDVRVIGRLHYATGFETRWQPGGNQLNPMMKISIGGGGHESEMTLFALNPRFGDVNPEMFSYQWAQNEQQREAIGRDTGNQLSIRIPEANVSLRVPVDEENTLDHNKELEFTPIEKSDWSYRLRSFHRSMAVGENQRVPIVVVEFKSGDRTITRWVSNDPARARDLTGAQQFSPPDPAVDVTFMLGSLVTLVAGPNASDVEVFVGGPDDRRRVNVGEPFDLGSGIVLNVLESYVSVRPETRPVIVSKRDRNPDAGAQLSHIKLELTSGDWTYVDWLRYHRYPLDNEQYAVPGRFFYQPTRCTLPDGTELELMFSRERRNLPVSLALEDFELKVHTGGFVAGNTTSVRDFISILRPYTQGEWGPTLTTSLNKPGEYGGYYFFQSEWDPGEMAFTGLGVGNRDGVFIQLLGTCIAVIGMIYVFYVKPIIKRRRQQAVWAEVARTKQHEQLEQPVAV